MTYGFSLLMRGKDATPETFVKFARRSEELELDALWCSSHVILPPQTRSGYVLIPGLKHPPHWNEGYWEPMTVLSYLAAVTERLLLGTSVIVLPMHHPIEMAKQVAEVDRLSGGRFVFGVGVGWFAEEFDVLGRDFSNRGARTDEALDMMKVLWRDEPAAFEGRYHSFPPSSFLPKPVQRPHPPIWIAGNSPAALKRAVRHGDAWHPGRLDFAQLKQGLNELAGYLEAAGRPPDSLELALKVPIVFQDGPPGEGQFCTEGRPQDIAAALRRYKEMGVDHFVLDVVPENLSTALDTMERFCQEVRPLL